jgi:anion-transporting  ArsA/GET3 family ATPase
LGAGGAWGGAQLDTKASLERLARRYATGEKLQTILGHPIFRALESLAGMQELMAIAVIGEAAGQKYDCIVVDTAPSRHALEFLDKPEFFVRMVTTPLVKLVGRTYHWWEKSNLGRVGLQLYHQVEKLAGAKLTRDVLEFFSAFQGVAEGYARETQKTLVSLRDAGTSAFTVVSSPFKARAEAAWFWEELQKRKFTIERLVVNRVWPQLAIAGGGAGARELIEWYGDVSTAQAKAWEAVTREYSSKIPRLLSLAELPTDIDGLPALARIAESLDS